MSYEKPIKLDMSFKESLRMIAKAGKPALAKGKSKSNIRTVNALAKTRQKTN